MGRDVTFWINTFTVSEENDGPTYLRKGAQEHLEEISYDAAVQRFGKARVALILRENADRLDPKPNPRA